MKKYIYQIFPVVAMLFLGSCEQDLDTEGISRVTFYNDIELVGDKDFVVEQGSTYTEPGASAFEGETEVTENVVISGTVDTNTPGHYTISYYIENVDGFGKTITRNVFVLPADRTISDNYTGTYTGVNSAGSFPEATVITHLGDGLYYSDDFIGGRYHIGFDYGPAYKISAYFYITGDGTSYEGLLTNSPWGSWDVVSQSLSGTTFTHNLQFGTFATPVELIKE
ncbi:immunoglobulin-like domain-containing protein [Ochrovirga pacifica]|uniref:immunoglobulin-like domain-containing protein n=1 Tax=Ochrovirga pacifica TaxID=1042376 RepID=UPI0002559DCF|nr:immunoglobulin-like domain-containing protein [Ochrovirga pacifica]